MAPSGNRLATPDLPVRLNAHGKQKNWQIYCKNLVAKAGDENRGEKPDSRPSTAGS